MPITDIDPLRIALAWRERDANPLIAAFAATVRRADRLASRAVIDGPVCLIVNPHAGGGRALRLLPGVEAALRSQGRPFRVVETMSMQHARQLAREACDQGDIVAAMGGDGIVGAVAGELRDRQGLLAVIPGGRGNDFARKLDIPFDPVEAVSCWRRARSAASTWPLANGTVYLGILSAGIDSDVSRIALRRG